MERNLKLIKKINYFTNIRINKEIVFEITFSFLVFLSFFEVYLQAMIGQITRYYIIFLAIILLLFFKKIKIRWYHGFYTAWFLFKLMSLFWTPNLFIARLHLFSHIGMTALLLIVTSLDIKEKSINFITAALWLFSNLYGVLSIFFSKPYLGAFNNRMVLNLGGLENDPNNQAAFLIIGIIISLHYIVKHRIFLLNVIFIVLNTFSLFQTGSRGGLLALLISLIVFVIININYKKNGAFKFILFVIIAVIVLAIMFIILPEVIKTRLFIFDDGGSGRLEIWRNSINLLMKNSFLFGAGWGADYGFNGVFSETHNTFISMAVDVGIVGVILFFGPIVVAILNLVKKKKSVYIPIIANTMVIAVFLGSINKRFFWLPIILLFLEYNSVNNK